MKKKIKKNINIYLTVPISFSNLEALSYQKNIEKITLNKLVVIKGVVNILQICK